MFSVKPPYQTKTDFVNLLLKAICLCYGVGVKLNNAGLIREPRYHPPPNFGGGATGQVNPVRSLRQKKSF